MRVRTRLRHFEHTMRAAVDVHYDRHGAPLRPKVVEADEHAVLIDAFLLADHRYSKR